MTNLHALDLDVTIERERARRLVDRFGGKDSEGGELARERRAHRFSAGFRKEMGERLDALLIGSSRSDGPRGSVARLEAELDERWHKTQQAAHALSGEADIGAEQMRRKLEERRSLVEGDLNQEAPEKVPRDFAAEVPTGIVASNVPAFEALKETLDEISVKSVLDFRSAGAGVLAAEAVATAAACTIANIDDTVKMSILQLDPDCPWEGSLQVLSKPGHFINSLRRYPYAVDTGKVPEDNVMGARHYLTMAEDLGGVDSFPAVQSLHRWVEKAVLYWDSQNPEEEEDVDADFQAAEAAAEAYSIPDATPARATASTALPKGGPSVIPPAPRSAPSSFQPPGFQPPSRDGSQVGAARAAPPLANGSTASSGSTSRPRSVQRGSERPTPSSRAAAGASSSRPSVPKQRPSASPRARPSTSSTPSTPAPAIGSRPAASPQPQRASLHRPGTGAAAGVPRQSSNSVNGHAPSATPSSTLRPAGSPHPRQGAGPSGGGSVHRIAASPGPRSNASPMVASPMTQQQRNSLPGAKGGRSPMRPATASRNGAQPVTSPTRPTASPRRTGSPRRNAASPRRASPPAPAGPGGLSSSKSTGSLASRSSFGGNNAAAAVTTLASRGMGASNQVANVGPRQSPVAQSAQSIQEWRRMLEETKKEVREIKAIESQMRWNLQREEKKQRVEEEKEEVQEIRDWRWRENDQMKAFVAEKAQEVRVQELAAAKQFQEFKREAKAVVKEEEQKVITEEYLKDLEISQWRAEQARIAREQQKEEVIGRIEGHLELKDIKQQKKNEEKMEDYENRVFEQNLEMANLQREIQREKEAMLQSLELTRQAQRVPVRDGRRQGGRRLP